MFLSSSFPQQSQKTPGLAAPGDLQGAGPVDGGDRSAGSLGDAAMSDIVRQMARETLSENARKNLTRVPERP